MPRSAVPEGRGQGCAQRRSDRLEVSTQWPEKNAWPIDAKMYTNMTRMPDTAKTPGIDEATECTSTWSTCTGRLECQSIRDSLRGHMRTHLLSTKKAKDAGDTENTKHWEDAVEAHACQATHVHARTMYAGIHQYMRTSTQPLTAYTRQPASIDVFRPPARLDMHTRITSSHRGRRLRPKPEHARSHTTDARQRMAVHGLGDAPMAGRISSTIAITTICMRHSIADRRATP